MAAIRNQATATEFIGSFTEAFPDLGLPEIAFAGRSNVGKSSALNTLLGSKKAARVSATPGRTQAINLFKIGSGCAFADLPGYGFARVPESVRAQWRRVIEGYLADRERLKLAIVLVDPRLDAQEMDVQLVNALGDMDLPTLVLATKIDKLTRNERTVRLAALVDALGLDADSLVPFSSHTGEGKDEVWDLIESVCST